MKTTSVAGAARVFGLAWWVALFAATSASSPAQTWSSSDVGAVGAAGSTSVSGSVYTVRGAGEDVWGPRDEFHFHHRTWTGDVMLITRVTGVEFTFNWAKAGVMIRSALTDNAQHAYALVSPEQNTSLVYRATTGGNTTAPSAVDFRQKSMPMWLRLLRRGDTIVMDYSNDGTHWFRRGTTTITLPSSVHVGLAVNSHVDATLCTATFDHFTVDALHPTALAAIPRGPTKVFLRWQDNDVDETGFEIERATDGVNFTRVGTAPAWSTPTWSPYFPAPPPPPSFTDTTASPSTTYQYRLRSVTPRGPSAYSNVISVTTPPPAPAGWNYEDIGDTAAMGMASLSGSGLTVSGAGSGVGSVTYRRESQFKGDLGVFVPGFSDEFQFLWRPWTGEGEIVARVTGFSGTTTGQAGVMVRTSSDASGFNVYAFGKPAGAGFGVTARPGTQTYPYEHFYYVRETSNYYLATSGPPPPFWLKLQRLSDGVISFRSDDGVNWTYLAWVRTPLAADVQFGLGVSSMNDGSATGALPAVLSTTFDNVRVGPFTTPPPAPQPPTNLHASQVLQTYIALEWTNPEPIYEGIEIQRSADGVNFTSLGRRTSPMLADSGLTPDTTYYYRGRTVRGTTFSPYSSVLTVRTQAMPAAPSDLAATALSATEIRLTWTDNATNENGYQIERSTDNVNFQWFVSPAANATTHTATGLAANTTYYFRVRAYVGAGASGYSNTASATTLGGGSLPNAPSNLVATAVSPTRVDLTWTDNSADETGFNVLRSTDNSNFTFLLHVGANVTVASDITANGSTTYYYRVYAANDNGGSLTSNTASATTPAMPPTGESWQSRDIGAVAAAGSSSESGGVVTLRASGADIWNAADEFHYRFMPMSGDGTITVRVTGLTSAHSWTKAGVMFRESLNANSRHVMMLISATAGTALQYRTATGGSSGGTAPTANSALPRWLRLVRSGNTFIGYESTNGTAWTQAGSITLTGLPSEAFVGLAATSHNDGMIITATFDNVTVTGTTPPGSLPAPTGLTAAAITSTRIDLAWTDNSPDETGFTIERSTGGGAFTAIGVLGADATSFSDVNVAATTTYSYRVFARRGTTTSAFSNVATATTPEPTPPPGTPTNLVATAVSNTRVDLSWTDHATDETHFQVERSTDNVTFANIGGTGPDNTQFSDVNAAPATTYHYRVRARRNEAASAWSNVASATTPSSLPPGVWQSQDIGAVAAAGGSSESSGRVSVTGSGADIWNTADEFHYRYQAWNGDGEIIARVTSLTNTNGWAKAGVMFRESLTDSARHAFMCVSIAHGTSLQYRTSLGGESGSTAPSESGGIHQWVRLVRTGSTFTGYSSLDGVTWTLAGSITIALPSSGYIGFAVTSHNDGLNCTATFENVSLTGGGTPPATPPNPPGNLVATAVSASQINVSWTDNSTNESGFEVESSTDNSNYTRLTTTSANATAFAHAGLSASTTYFYRVRAVNAAGPSIYSNVASAATHAAPPPSATWTSQDIGAVAVSGSTNESGGTITLTGSGADIWNTADEFRYHHRAFTGDGEIIARIATLTNTHGWAKAGVMLRESLDANARHAAMFVSIAHGTALQYRVATGGESGSTAPSESGGVPRWLRLVRSGTTFTGYASPDGSTWTLAGSITLDLPATIHVGLAITSHNDGVSCTATFSNISVAGGGAAPPPTTVNAPTGLTAAASSSSQINLGWTDNATNETEFQVQRSPDNAVWTTLATLGANVTTYSDTAVSAGTTYYYRVRALAGTTPSNWSNTASVTTPGTPPPPTWSFGDIGSVGVAGSNESGGNTITVRGSGADIWDTADGFRFVYRSVTGDCTVEAQVSSLTNTHAWAKAGVMIRESAAAGARNVFAFVTPANGIHAQQRASAGGTTVSTAGRWWGGAQQWVRLVRAGNRITAFWSGDSIQWTQFAVYDVTMGASVLVGFAVTSHDNTQLATAIFTDPFVE